jgi:beta-carotene 3-hydroxylase
MEFMAWFTHKYIMHGFLWRLHKDHHTGSEHFLEKNDWFALIFAIPSWLFIMLGVIYSSPASIVIGSGMTAYGIAYFLVHDVFVHQRIKILRNAKHPYFRALRRAHKMHHKHLDRHHGESFGFLIVGKKYFEKKPNSLLDK